jgi:repressor LexA
MKLAEFLNNNVKYLRTEKKISQQCLADAIGVDRSTVSRIENGEIETTVDNAIKIANKLNVSLNDLVSKDLRFDNGEIIDLPTDNVKIPVLGRIPAGMPFEAIEEQYTTDYEEIPRDWLRGGNEYFALKLDGDSMEPEYQDKDVVIFRKTFDCESGQDCCVRINGYDATFKRVKKQLNGIMVIPLNENNSTGFTTTFYTNEDVINMPIEILGVVKQIRRNR